MNTFVQFSRRIRCQVYRANVGGQPTVRVYDGEVEESLDLLDDVDVLDIVSDMVLHALTGRVSGIENAEGHLGEIYKAGRGALQIGNGRGRCRPVYVVATYTAPAITTAARCCEKSLPCSLQTARLKSSKVQSWPEHTATSTVRTVGVGGVHGAAYPLPLVRSCPLTSHP